MHCLSHLHEVTAEVNKQTDCNKHKADRQNFKTCLLKINICHLQNNMHPTNSSCFSICAVRSLESLAARLPVSHDRTAQNNSISVSTSILFTPSSQWLRYSRLVAVFVRQWSHENTDGLFFSKLGKKASPLLPATVPEILFQQFTL